MVVTQSLIRPVKQNIRSACRDSSGETIFNHLSITVSNMQGHPSSFSLYVSVRGLLHTCFIIPDTFNAKLGTQRKCLIDAFLSSATKDMQIKL